MKKSTRSILFWTPRILGILFILFVGMFSLDVFGTGAGFWPTLVGFIIHNIPALLMLAGLLIGWHWEWVGALGFFSAAVFLEVMSRSTELFFVLLFIAVPVLIGSLFLAGWFLRRKVRG